MLEPSQKASSQQVLFGASAIRSCDAMDAEGWLEAGLVSERDRDAVTESV
jgi:hypothetical protein